MRSVSKSLLSPERGVSGRLALVRVRRLQAVLMVGVVALVLAVGGWAGWMRDDLAEAAEPAEGAAAEAWVPVLSLLLVLGATGLLMFAAGRRRRG